MLYVRYTVSNPGKHPYRVGDPQVYRLTPKLASEHVVAFKGMQIPEQGMSMFGGVSAVRYILTASERMLSHDAATCLRVYNLVNYLEKLQAPTR